MRCILTPSLQTRPELNRQLDATRNCSACLPAIPITPQGGLTLRRCRWSLNPQLRSWRRCVRLRSDHGQRLDQVIRANVYGSAFQPVPFFCHCALFLHFRAKAFLLQSYVSVAFFVPVVLPVPLDAELIAWRVSVPICSRTMRPHGPICGLATLIV